MDVIPIVKDIAIKIEDLSYRYPDGTQALAGINLIVRRGESLGVIGPNGAGKSTLAMHLNGILMGNSLIEIMGLTVNKKNIRDIRGIVGLVFQDPDDQLFSPTVREDVAFGPLCHRLSPERVDHSVRRALEWVGMEGSEARSPHHMSYGEKKRIALATVLSMDPEILVLDEPTANLDPRGKRGFVEVLKSLHVTKLIITHDQELVRDVCGRIVIMDSGKIVADGSATLVLSDRELLDKHGLL